MTIRSEINDMPILLRATCAAALALAFTLPAAVADAGSAGPYAVHATSQRRAPVRTVGEQQGQIACTKYGCMRIPPRCHPEQTYNAWGDPTGHDAIVCP